MIYSYYNRRPDGQEIEDCVCRAISTATGLKYKAVNKLLTLVADYGDCDRLCVDCYDYLLEDVLGYEVHKGNKRTVREIVEEYDNCKLLLRLNGHLTCAMYGTLLDIWDCSKKIVDRFWIVI